MFQYDVREVVILSTRFNFNVYSATFEMEINALWKAFVFILIFKVCNGSLEFIIDKNVTCDKLQEKFALAAQQFTNCSIANARPITFCESCVDSYIEVLASHTEILEGNEDGVNCKQMLINMDRLEIIETFYTNFVQLWDKGECNYCFVLNPNGTITSVRNNNTIKFHSLDSIVRECVQKNIQNKSIICSECLAPYKNLNDFYNTLKYSNESGRVCMDIVDSMNASRMEWSKDLGCKFHPGTDLPLILSASFASLMPIIFYFLAKKYSTKIETRLLEQSRLAGQLNSPSSSCVS